MVHCVDPCLNSRTVRQAEIRQDAIIETGIIFHVTGFIEKAPRTLVKRGDWQVFGDPRESLCRMRLYRWVEHLAEKIIENCQDIESCLEKIGNINITQTAGS